MQAAHLMVSSLAGSLALVTCKEPLRTAMTNQLSHLIASQGVVGIEKTMLEQVRTRSSTESSNTLVPLFFTPPLVLIVLQGTMSMAPHH